MAAARIPIDDLPAAVAAVAGDLMVIQRDDVTMKLLVSVLTDALLAALTAHINDTTDAHDATAISTTVSGTGVESATVQGQLVQLAALVLNRVTIGGGVNSIVKLSQAEYDALPVKVATTLYIISG